MVKVIDLTGCEDADQSIAQRRRLHEDEPNDLLCPISGVMFRDPVVLLASGITFDRQAIEEWLSKGKLTCPVTRVPVTSDNVVLTNFTARGSVERWLRENSDRTPEGWNTREMLPPTHPQHGVLRTWRAMCPALQEIWPETAKPELWRGVTIKKSRVVELYLENFGLTGALPAEVGRLSALESLHLSENQLTSLPAEIGQLTSLKELELYNNKLTSLPPEIGQLRSLERLDLCYNQLTIVPADIGQLTSLTELHLFGNKLTGVPPEIGQLTLLVLLCLGDNQLTSVPPEIGQLTALRELALRGNQLTSVPPEIGQLRSLKVLTLTSELNDR
ncbi:MAG: hypothetical protein CME10_14880 [Gemmatimonadetes bacterium]|nr:hypothetical protein [Gemmatimonadota bacterium]